jgi:hypothetical protein
MFPRVLIIILKTALKHRLQAHNLSSSILSGVESIGNGIIKTVKYENSNIFSILRISAHKLLEVFGVHLIDIVLLYFLSRFLIQ